MTLSFAIGAAVTLVLVLVLVSLALSAFLAANHTDALDFERQEREYQEREEQWRARR